MKPKLMDSYVHARAESGLVSRKDTFYQAVKAKLPISSIVRLQAYPAVVIEDIGFLSIVVDDFNQFLSKGNDKIIDKCHPVRLARISRHVRHMELSLVDKVLRSHSVAVLFRELVQSQVAHGVIVRSPVREQMPVSFAAPPYPDKIVEHGSKTHHSGVGMRLAPVPHPVKQILPDLGISGVDLHQMLLVPIVGSMVVHGNLFPDAVCQEAHRVFMERDALSDRHAAAGAVVNPSVPLHFSVRGAVVDLPVFHGPPAVIHCELLPKEAVHQANGHLIPFCHRCRGAQERLLQLVPVRSGPLIVVADDADGGINTMSRMDDLIRKSCPIAVPDHIGSPLLCHF